MDILAHIITQFDDTEMGSCIAWIDDPNAVDHFGFDCQVDFLEAIQSTELLFALSEDGLAAD